MINKELNKFLSTVVNRFGPDCIRYMEQVCPSDQYSDSVSLLIGSQRDDQEFSNQGLSNKQVLSRTSKKVGTIFSAGIGTASSIISKSSYVVGDPFVNSLADCLGPIGTANTVMQRITQLVRWMKTQAHLSELRIIYEFAQMAVEEGGNEPKGETLDAIAYAIDQKEKKKNRSGVQGFVPILNMAVKFKHRFKEHRGENRKHYANVLARNAKEIKDPWAQCTVRSLVGEKWSGYGIEQLMKELETKLKSW